MTEMRDVDHTHPHTGEAFGFRFHRGKVVADGGPESDGSGAPSGIRSDGGDDTDEERMADVTHDTHEGATRTFERGTEGRDDTV